MAKKPEVASGLADIFANTTGGGAGQQVPKVPADNSDLGAGIIHPMGVGLRTGEIEALDDIAGTLGVARNAVIHYAVRWFIIQYRRGLVDLAGDVEAPPPPKKRLKLRK